jgi:hypothetical protein
LAGGAGLAAGEVAVHDEVLAHRAAAPLRTVCTGQELKAAVLAEADVAAARAFWPGAAERVLEDLRATGALFIAWAIGEGALAA